MSLGTSRLSAILSIFVALAVATDAATAQEEKRGGLEEIVVTARKREELLVDTPVSVTALSETALRDAGVTRLDDIKDLVPNLQFSIGRENQEGFISLRGVGTTSGEIVFDPGVAVYVDGVFLPRMIGQLIDVVDVEQVEVLRGPQGTLFGKNSVGGAFSVTTIKPQPELGGSVLVSAGRFDTVRTRVSLNLPIIEDRLLSRFAFATSQNDGYSRNELLGIDVSDTNSQTFLGSLRLLLTDDITIDLSGSWSRTHGHGRGGQCRVIDESGLARNYDGFFDACNSSEPFRFRGDARGLSDTRSWGTWGTVTWDAIEGPVDLSIKSISSWREQKPGHRSESDSTEFPVLSLNFSGRDGNATWSQYQFSEELQSNLTAWDDRFSLVTGVFAFWERGIAPTGVSALGGFLDVETLSTTRVRNWTWALYTHAVVDPVDWLSLTLGVRYTQDKKGASLVVLNRVNGMVDGAGEGSEVFDDVTPTASLSLKAPDQMLHAIDADHLNAYFTWSAGFRGGGFNALINVQGSDGDLSSFQPETLNNFELGIKTVAFDNRVSLNLAGFYATYDDIQVVTSIATGDPGDPTTITIQQLTQNAAKATVQGIEAEFQANPVADLTVLGSLGLLNTKFDNFGRDCIPETGENCAVSSLTIDPERVNLDRSGQGFNISPDLTAFVAIAYAFQVDALYPTLVGDLTPRVEWSYQGRMHVLGPEAVDSIQRGYNLINARLAYTFYDDRAQIALWGKNLSDETYFDRAESFPILGFMTRYFQSPRTFGGEVSLRF